MSTAICIKIIIMNNLLKLTQSLDALFPIGSYTLSNGMETYVQKGIVKDMNSLEKYLDSYLYMLKYNELAFAAQAYKGCDITGLDSLYSALKSPSEIRSGSIKQCARFLKIHMQLDNYPLLSKYRSMIMNGECDGHYCIAVGLFIKEIDAELNAALELYCYSILSSMVNHAVKLVPLRQLDGQLALHNILSKIPDMVDRAIRIKPDYLGAGGCGFDLRSMQHEKLYSRLYIS